MPNVAGREFPYTPQGMAAADRYRQSQGMRHGGSMGFRPLGYQDGSLVEPGVTPALGYTTPSLERFGPTELPGSTVHQSGTQRMRETIRGIGQQDSRGNSISDAIDKVSSLVQEFAAQGVPDPVKEAVNSAIATFGIPVDVVNAALKFLGIPVSDTPIGGSRNLIETFGFAGDQGVTPGYSLDQFGRIERPEDLVRPRAGPRGAPDEEPMEPVGPMGPMPNRKPLEPDDMELLLPEPSWMSDPRFKGYYDPDQLNPFFNPHEIPVADGGYVGRGMRHGGSMGFRPINPLVATGTGRRVAEETLQDPGLAGPINPLVATGMGRRAAQRSGALSGAGAGGVAEPFSYDSESRVAVIEKIMFLTKMENPLVFLEMSDEQLRATLAKVEKDALAREMQQMQQIPPPPPMLKMPPRLRPPESLLPSPQHQQQGPLMQPPPPPPPPPMQRPSDRDIEELLQGTNPPGIYRESGLFKDIPGVDRKTRAYYPPLERRHGGVMSIRRR